jgi:hypothetical protein
MGCTVHNITGFAHKTSGGMSLVFPDVCKTPAPPAPFVPIPYPNIGKSSDTSQGTAGTIGGMLSGVFKQECEYLMYSFNVMLEGKNVCRMGDPLWHNKKNICG